MKHSLLLAAFATALTVQSLHAEYVITLNDGSRHTVESATVAPFGTNSFTIGSYPADKVTEVAHNPVGQSSPLSTIEFPEGTPRRVAILDVAAVNNETEASGDFARAVYSAEYMASVAGLPSFTTTSFTEAMEGADLILISSRVRCGKNKCNTIPAATLPALRKWIEDGGVLVAPLIETGTDEADVLSLFGLDAVAAQAKNHTTIKWDASLSAPELVYFDQPEELETCIYNNYIQTVSYTPSASATVLGRYDDGTPAVVKNTLGKGATYTVGLKWRDVVARAQMNKDDEKSHPTSNAYVPGADIYSLLLRAIYVANRPFTAWKYTVPDGKDAVLIPTHDCDSNTAYEEMYWMGDYEHSLGVNGHYFFTAHYFRDSPYMSAFYNDANIERVKALVAQGHTLGSHSICHFPDFNVVDRFPYEEVTEQEYSERAHLDNDTKISTGGSTWAEIVLSKRILERDISVKCRGFRSGHLCTNRLFPKALVEGGYDFASCYAAADLSANTPFFVRDNNDWAGSLTPVLQMPLHFSDVYKADPMDENNWRAKAESWHPIFEKLRGNYLSSIILIHPNREYKMQALKVLVDKMDLTRTSLYNLYDYGDFWVGRDKFTFDMASDADGNVIVRAKADDLKANPHLSIVVETGTESKAPASITLIDETGKPHTVRISLLSPSRYLLSW